MQSKASPLTPVAALAVAAGLLIAGALVHQLAAVMLLCLPIAILVALRRRLERPYLSPVWITCLVLVVTGGLGTFMGTRLSDLEGGGIRLGFPAEFVGPTARLFAGSSLYLVL